MKVAGGALAQVEWVTDRYSRFMVPYPSIARLLWRFRDITDGECIDRGTQRNRRRSKHENAKSAT